MSEILKRLLIEEEGRRTQPYFDSKGLVTVGVGHLCDPHRVCPMPDRVIDLLLDYDMTEKRGLAARIPGFSQLNEVQQAVVVSMVFQMGFEPFDGDGVRDFKKFLAAVAVGDVKTAASQMLDSDWARKDSPLRAKRAAQMMETGEWVDR